ncbi:MAG TPA: pentapeptide repeat-containing protein, partial [Ktedonobacterales bacterium]
MSNDKHLEILWAGVRKWNNWRKLHPDVSPDLAGANLGDGKVGSQDLTYIDLHGANLRGAALSGVVLHQANL